MSLYVYFFFSEGHHPGENFLRDQNIGVLMEYGTEYAIYVCVLAL